MALCEQCGNFDDQEIENDHGVFHLQRTNYSVTWSSVKRNGDNYSYHFCYHCDRHIPQRGFDI